MSQLGNEGLVKVTFSRAIVHEVKRQGSGNTGGGPWPSRALRHPTALRHVGRREGTTHPPLSRVPNRLCMRPGTCSGTCSSCPGTCPGMRPARSGGAGPRGRPWDGGGGGGGGGWGGVDGCVGRGEAAGSVARTG
eukprot:scaffold20484_cov92-Isochrysis_galbana.AAC.3